MKTLSLTTLVLSLFSVSALAIPGGIIANGGQTVLCETPDKAVQSVESFDLYEGRVVYGHEYDRYVGDPVAKAIQLAEKIDQAEISIRQNRADQTTVADRVRIVAKNMQLLDGQKLTPTHDSKGYEIILNGCKLVPTINFYSENKILVSNDAWKHLYDVDKAALYLHEAVYWHLRQTGVERDSRRTRKIVSYLMSDRELESVAAIPKKINSQVQFCQGKGTRFWAYENAQGKLTLQFIEVGGFMMPTRTTMTSETLSDAPQFPIAPSRQAQMASGNITSRLDNEMLFQLYWVNDRISLKGQIQNKVNVSVNVTCHML